MNLEDLWFVTRRVGVDNWYNEPILLLVFLIQLVTIATEEEESNHPAKAEAPRAQGFKQKQTRTTHVTMLDNPPEIL